MNQPTNEEQRSLAKMTTSPVTASNILEAWGGRPQGESQGHVSPSQRHFGTIKSILQALAIQEERVHLRPLQISLGKLLILLVNLLGG